MDDFTSIHQITKEEILSVLELAATYQKDGIPHDALQGRLMASLFFEPSTRTRVSFEAAAKRLGMGVVGFSGTEGTSIKKGETFEDTIQAIDGYVDVIVIRHPEMGSAQRAANLSEHSVINAGDGANEHPTQTLLDLYTIQQTQGTLDGLTIAMAGDLKYGRVPHSLAKALAHFPTTKQVWVSPLALMMPDEVLRYCEERGVTVIQTESLEEVMDDVDILMMTRVQQERFENKGEYEHLKDVYVLRPEMLKGVRKDFKIMHPLPRLYELPADIDNLPQAYYFQQAYNGMYVRAALLTKMLQRS